MTMFWQGQRVKVAAQHQLHGFTGRVVAIFRDDTALVFFDKEIPDELRAIYRNQKTNATVLRPEQCAPLETSKT